MKAHQDDNVAFDKLSQKLQLNCICNHLAKQHISNLVQQQQRNNSLFPLEPIGVFIKGAKLSSDTGQLIQFQQKKIVSGNGFNKVGWDSVHSTLHSVLRLFQVWASKHVLGIAGTMKFLSHQDDRKSVCPSCLSCEEACSHIALCPEIRRTKAFQQSVAGITSWMAENTTHPDIKAVITAYAIGRGQVSCIDCAADYPTVIQDFAMSQDKIGWGNFMVGMISSKLISIQESHLRLCAPHQLPEKWAIWLITQLLQVTHTQSIYRCLLVQDRTSGTLITLHKTKLLEEITKQLSMGAENLMEDDKYLLECNLLDIATTSREQQEYWLLAIKAARMASLIQQQTTQQQCITNP